MFILYINDIGTSTSSSIRLFADDYLLYRVVKRASDACELQKYLSLMCSWADAWQMAFKADKCSVLTITNKKVPLQFSYKTGDKTLKHVDHHPYLGVEFAGNLSWEHHVNQVVPKAQRILNLLRRNLTGCPQTTIPGTWRTRHWSVRCLSMLVARGIRISPTTSKDSRQSRGKLLAL